MCIWVIGQEFHCPLPWLSLGLVGGFFTECVFIYSMLLSAHSMVDCLNQQGLPRVPPIVKIQVNPCSVMSATQREYGVIK